MRKCRWFHDWGQWKDIWSGRYNPGYIKDPGPRDGIPVIIQERRCKDCNAAQRRYVEPGPRP